MATDVHDSPQAVPHLLEILKILEGAVASDPQKVAAYGEQLAARLEADGSQRAAASVRSVLARVRTREISAARAVTGRVPVDGESRLALGDLSTPRADEEVVYLPQDAAERVEEFLAFVGAADRLLVHGVGISPTLLLFGPPGCGKTALARFVAARLQLPLITARVDSLISAYLGNTAKNLRALFEHAMSRPCVLFLDEFDALAKLRDDQHELGELKRVVVSLLQNIDNLDSKTVLLAATNHDHLLDPAIWRRFAFKVQLGPPAIEERLKIIERALGAFGAPEIIADLGHLCESLSGAEIVDICTDAKRSAILRGDAAVSELDVFRRVLAIKTPAALKAGTPIGERARAMRSASPAIFTYRRIAALLSVSLGHVAKLLGEGEAAHAV